MSSKVYSLMVHNDSDSHHDILLNPTLFDFIVVGDYVQVSSVDNPDEKLVLKITSLQSKGGRLEVSLLKTVADTLDLKSFNRVLVEKIDLKKGEVANLTSINIIVKCGRTLHVGQSIEVGGVQLQVQELGKFGKQTKSGIVTEATNIIFRSRSTRIFWLVEISSEMWEVDMNGEMYFEKFLNKFVTPVLERWKALNTVHSLSIVFFTRTYYLSNNGNHLSDFRSMNEDSSYSSDHENKAITHVHQDLYYQDFFKVVLSNATGDIDKVSFLKSLKHSFWEFPKVVGWDLGGGRASGHHQYINKSNMIFHRPPVAAAPGLSSEINVLEAINTTLNLLDKHYMDRDLLRTGNSIVLISPGCGFYKVDPQLAQITKQRMMDTGIGMDLICLSQPPLHVTPLFFVQQRDDIGGFYEVPHWITVSYIDKDDWIEAMAISHISLKKDSESLGGIGELSCRDALRDSNGSLRPFEFQDILRGYCLILDEHIPKFALAGDTSRAAEISRVSKVSLSTVCTLDAWRKLLPHPLLLLLEHFESNKSIGVRGRQFKQTSQSLNCATESEPSTTADNVDKSVPAFGYKLNTWGDISFRSNVCGVVSPSVDICSSLISEIVRATVDNSKSQLSTDFIYSSMQNFDSEISTTAYRSKEVEQSHIVNRQSSYNSSIPAESSSAKGPGEARLSATSRRPNNFCGIHRNLTEKTDTSAATSVSGDFMNHSSDEEALVELSTSPTAKILSHYRRSQDHHARQSAILTNHANYSLNLSTPSNPSDKRNQCVEVHSIPAMSARALPIAIPGTAEISPDSSKFAYKSSHSTDISPDMCKSSSYDKTIELGQYRMKRNDSNTLNDPFRSRTLSQSSSVGSFDIAATDKKREKQKVSIPDFQRVRYGINPFKREEGKNFMELRTHNRRRWSHVFLSGHLLDSYSKDNVAPNWPSLCQPAVLPLAVDYIPSCEDLLTCYTHSVYDMILDPHLCPFTTPEALLYEMVCQRLAQEFQIVEGKGIDREAYKKFVRKGLESQQDQLDDNFWMLSMGHRIQFLYYIPSSRTIKVDRYVSKMGNNDASSTATYSYQLWLPQSQQFSTITQVFHQYPEPEYNWNQADEVLLGNDDDLSDSAKAKRLRFAIVPSMYFDSEADSKYVEYCDNFQNLIKHLKKYCLNPDDLTITLRDSKTINTIDSIEQRGSSNSKLKVKLWLSKPGKESPQWVHMQCDQIYSPFEIFHFELYWIVCYSWLIDDFINVLFRRCLSWKLRIIQIPEYFRWDNMHLHPFRLHPFISVPILEESSLFTGQDVVGIEKDLRSEYVPTVNKLEKWLLIECKSEWIPDDNQTTNWSAIGLNEPDCDMGKVCPNLVTQFKRKVVIDPQATVEDCGEQMFCNSLHIEMASPQEYIARSADHARNSRNIASKQFGDMSKIDQPLYSKPPPILQRRQKRHVHYDRQYMQRMGYAAVRIGASGFLWLESSVPKANDSTTSSSDEKKEICAFKQFDFRKKCSSHQICYELVILILETSMLKKTL